MQRIFSGVQPTGNLHLGNYLGAIRNWVRLQEEYECIFCMVDLHAVTVWQDPAVLRANTRELAAGMIASGIDPKTNTLFNQSSVSAHAELGWIFNCVARMGWLNRMTQFKEKAGKHKENASVGLFVYPALMAADILAYKATHVPVGEDQKQHLELTRDIAQKFNNDFGKDFFPLPEPLILGPATRVMSLRDGSKKMSKSEPSDLSRINMTDDADMIARKLKKAKTDSEPLPGEIGGLSERPEAANLLNIFAALSGRPAPDILADFAGQNFAGFKAALIEVAIAKLCPITDEMARLSKETGYIDRILTEGGEQADSIARPILREVKEIIGFLQP